MKERAATKPQDFDCVNGMTHVWHARLIGIKESYCVTYPQYPRQVIASVTLISSEGHHWYKDCAWYMLYNWLRHFYFGCSGFARSIVDIFRGRLHHLKLLLSFLYNASKPERLTCRESFDEPHQPNFAVECLWDDLCVQTPLSRVGVSQTINLLFIHTLSIEKNTTIPQEPWGYLSHRSEIRKNLNWQPRYPRLCLITTRMIRNYGRGTNRSIMMIWWQ